jgi:hypothetical protein
MFSIIYHHTALSHRFKSVLQDGMITEQIRDVYLAV